MGVGYDEYFAVRFQYIVNFPQKIDRVLLDLRCGRHLAGKRIEIFHQNRFAQVSGNDDQIQRLIQFPQFFDGINGYKIVFFETVGKDLGNQGILGGDQADVMIFLQVFFPVKPDDLGDFIRL